MGEEELVGCRMQMDQKDIERRKSERETGLIFMSLWNRRIFFNVHLPSVCTFCDSSIICMRYYKEEMKPNGDRSKENTKNAQKYFTNSWKEGDGRCIILKVCA